MADRIGRLQTLAQVALGEKGVVAVIRFDNEARNQLAALGLRTGSELRVIQRTADGPVLVAIQDNRIAVDAAMAGKIMISPIGQ